MHDLRYGYNLADIHDIARHAVHTDRSHHAGDYLDRFELAWSAVAEYLYLVDAAPTRQDLLRYARYALQTDAQDDMRHRGVSHHTRETSVNAVRYWAFHQVTPSHESAVVDRQALWQIWWCLRDTDRRALLALAAHGDYAQAAYSLDMKYHAFHRTVRLARGRFLALWHDGEQPSGLWGRDRRASGGGEPAAAVRMIARRRTAAAARAAEGEAA